MCKFGTLVFLALLVLLPVPLRAQGNHDLEESRRRLEEIRAERDRLERQRELLQGQVHDVNDELSNLEHQRESTQRIVNEIERQIGGLATQLDRSSAELILAQDNLAERRAVLQRCLVADVEQLRNRVVQQRNNILNVRGELDRRREEREAEATKYSELASERARKLQTLQRSARNTERRLGQLQRDESRLN